MIATVVQLCATPEISDLSIIGATEAQEALAQISINFLESLDGTNARDQAYEGELAKRQQNR